MNRPRMIYFEREDILRLAISGETEAQNVEVNSNITAELNDRGELIGIQILDASEFLRNTIAESVQARLPAIQWAEVETTDRRIGSSVAGNSHARSRQEPGQQTVENYVECLDKAVNDTYGRVHAVRDLFCRQVETPNAEITDPDWHKSLPPEHQEEFHRMRDCHIAYRQFSDMVVFCALLKNGRGVLSLVPIRAFAGLPHHGVSQSWWRE